MFTTQYVPIKVRDVNSYEVLFPSLDQPISGLNRDLIWIGSSGNLGFVIRRPVAEESLPN